MKSRLIGQLAVYLGIYCNAIAFTIIFPFGSLMVQQFGMAEDRSSTGPWVGLLAFAMMASRLISSPLWGVACDKWGRRPCSLTGIAAVILFSLSFGLSWNYWWALASRAMLGALCSLSLVTKVILGELTNSDPGAMAWLVISWQFGDISGNIIGGLLVDPNGSGLTDWWVFDEFPFLLPNLVVSSLGVIGLILQMFFVPETLQKQDGKEVQTRGLIQLLQDRRVLHITALYFMLSMNVAAFHELVALWCWADKENGGFGMSTMEIGNILGISSAVLLLLESRMYSWLRKYMNIVELTKYMCIAGCVVMCLVPLASLLKEYQYLKYFAVGFASFSWWMISFVWLTNTFVMQNNCVPNSERGKMSGISMGANSAAKALSPLLFGSLFASTAKSGLSFPFNFAFSFLLMGGICVLCYFCSLSRHLSSSYMKFEEQAAQKELARPLLTLPIDYKALYSLLRYKFDS